MKLIIQEGHNAIFFFEMYGRVSGMEGTASFTFKHRASYNIEIISVLIASIIDIRNIIRKKHK